jgi:hypothetical protein
MAPCLENQTFSRFLVKCCERLGWRRPYKYVFIQFLVKLWFLLGPRSVSAVREITERGP